MRVSWDGYMPDEHRLFNSYNEQATLNPIVIIYMAVKANKL